MAKQTINLGTGPDAGDGDDGRTGGQKINENFDELYADAGKLETHVNDVSNPHSVTYAQLPDKPAPYDDTALTAAVALNTAKVSNVDHPLVETAVPAGAVFTDTVYDDSGVLLTDGSREGATGGTQSFTNSIDVGGADNLFTDNSYKGITYTTTALSHVLVSGTLGIKGASSTSRFLMGEGLHNQTSMISHSYQGGIPINVTTTINAFTGSITSADTGGADFSLTENKLQVDVTTGSLKPGKLTVSKQEARLGGTTGSGVDIVNILEASYDLSGFNASVYPNVTGILCSGGNFFGSGVFQNLRGIYIDSDFWAKSYSGVLTGVGVEVEPCTTAANSTKGIWLKGGKDTAGQLVFGASAVNQIYSDGTDLVVDTGTGSAVLPKETGIGLKVDVDVPTFGFRDITGTITVRGAGANDPAWSAISGSAMSAYKFAVSDECWMSIHIPHDYVEGTDISFHAHWLSDGTDTTNTVKWDFEYMYAKGHNQEVFPVGATSTVSIEQASGAQYQHMVTESADVTIAGLEPDGIIYMRLERGNNAGTDTANGIFVLQTGVHYQSTNMATKSKTPNFYGA